MATYKFTTVTNGSTEFQKDSGPLHTLEITDTVDELDATRIIMRTHFGQEVIDVTVDTVLDNATTYGPGSAIHTVYRALNILFPKGNTSPAGTGTPSTQVTSYQEATATAGQTVFPFTLPATGSDFFVVVNGSFIRPFFYTYTPTALTMSTGQIAGDVVSVQQIK